jgi:hypothetical protein
MKVMIDKHKRLRSLTSPRIILIGGSNLAYGVDSKAIEEQLKIPVVNMGVHAGLGLNFILNEIKSDVRNGDILILSIEYYLADPVDALISHTIDVFPDAITYFPLHFQYTRRVDDITTRLSNVRKQLQKSLDLIDDPQLTVAFNPVPDPEKTTIYRRDAFNEYGDAIGQLNLTPPGVLVDRFTMTPDDYSRWIILLNKFAKYSLEKGASVYFMFAHFPQSEYKKNKSSIKIFEKQLKEKLDIRIMNTPESLVLPDSCFFDTVYHLNRTGRAERTRRMIEILRENHVGN